MRRLKLRDDRGGVLILTVLVMVMLLGAVALATDGSALVVAKRSAQNSADAAALALAQDCMRPGGTCPSSSSPYLRSGQTSSVSTGAGSVTVKVDERVNYNFATVLGRSGDTVTRSATARWGALTTATAPFPITISTCAFTGMSFDVKVTLHSYDVPGCATGSGQFGFIQGGCTNQTVSVGNVLPGTTGNNLIGTGCTEASMNALLNTDVLVPVWTPPYSGGFPITAYAVFRLTGWSTNGNSAGGTLLKQCDASQDGGVDDHQNMPCIRGYFKGFATQSGGTTGGTCNTNLFACYVYLDR